MEPWRVPGAGAPDAEDRGRIRVVLPGRAARVPAEDCHQALGATLLYAGISPRQPAALIGSVSLPLDLQHNKRHPFHARLSVLRREARVRALG